MTTTVSTASSPTAEKYWPELKELSDKEKLNLIVKLSTSMQHDNEYPKQRKGWASKFVGKWQDSRSAEEIVADIRAARTQNTFDVEL